ncbi:hypothetical protein [Bradyrhizobium sp. Tv2a-2]|uniref:hypothetical protein n=1 Tax=Bradyrhizobium sp. Tv2a-2 TaxID=113395 RepID=UPI001FD8A4F7|nr:hypothetical protein [Bradyrhizobium sp. Tv2a-2]
MVEWSTGALATLFRAAMENPFLTVALFAMLASVTARAADMPVKAPPPPPPPYNWSGFYLGANLGGAWTNGSLNIPGNNLYGGITEFVGGVQAGYNFQLAIFCLVWKVI